LKSFLKYQFPPLLWVIVIYVLSANPAAQLSAQTPPGVEKIVHALLYFVLCWLVWRSFFFQDVFPLMRNGAYLGAFIFCVTFGVLDEYHHDFVSGRTADFFNVIADVGGVLLFVAIASLGRRVNEKGGKGRES
jgi:VanZ family protein